MKNSFGLYIQCLIIIVGLGFIVPHAIELSGFGNAESIDFERVREAGRNVQQLGNKMLGKNIRRFSIKSSYRISISLLVDSTAEHPVHWEIRDAIDDYLNPFITRLRQVVHTEIDTQVLYHSRLHRDGKQQLSIADLQSFMSANNWNPNSFIHKEAQLHLMVYLPQDANSTIYSSDGKQTDAFVIQGWGGVVVLPMAAKVTGVVSKSQLKLPMEKFQKHICELLEIQDSRLGEADMKNWVMNYLVFAVESLEALNDLFVAHPDVDLSANIREKVEGSLLNIENTVREMNIIKQIDYARKSFDLADSAFFDPSLLPTLYSPPEHYLGVYLPFLFPVLLPIVSGLFRVLKNMKN